MEEKVDRVKYFVSEVRGTPKSCQGHFFPSTPVCVSLRQPAEHPGLRK
jgi:hypothetical protein